MKKDWNKIGCFALILQGRGLKYCMLSLPYKKNHGNTAYLLSVGQFYVLQEYAASCYEVSQSYIKALN